MDNFKKNSKKVLSSVVLSGVVLGSTTLSNVSFNKVFAMQEAEENVKQDFLETDMFKFLLKKVTNDEISDIENKWNWDNFEPVNCEDYLKNKSLVTLVKIYKFAENNCKNDNFEIKSKAEALLKKLEEIFNNVDLIKQKVKDYLILLNENNIELDGSSTGELGLYKSLWENISGSEKTSDDDSLSLKLSDMLKLSRILPPMLLTVIKTRALLHLLIASDEVTIMRKSMLKSLVLSAVAAGSLWMASSAVQLF